MGLELSGSGYGIECYRNAKRLGDVAFYERYEGFLGLIITVFVRWARMGRGTRSIEFHCVRFGPTLLLYIPPLTSHLPTSAMPSVFTHEFDTLAFKGKVSFDTGIFINGQFVDGSDRSTIE